MKYNEKLEAMIGFVEDNFTNVKELVEWLELTIEDVVQCFPDALVNSYEKVFPLDLEELDDLSEAEELVAWNGVEVFGMFNPMEDLLNDER
jgi:hypothetical protein